MLNKSESVRVLKHVENVIYVNWKDMNVLDYPTLPTFKEVLPEHANAFSVFSRPVNAPFLKT